MTTALVIFALVLLLTGGGIVLLLRAQSAQRREQVALRLRMLGGDDAAAALAEVQPRGPELENPLVRAVSHLLWRTGVEVEAETVQKALLLSLLVVPVAVFLFGFVGGLLILAVTGALVWGWLTRQAARRRARVLEQLPPFLESVMRVLAAGSDSPSSSSLKRIESEGSLPSFVPS